MAPPTGTVEDGDPISLSVTSLRGPVGVDAPGPAEFIPSETHVRAKRKCTEVDLEMGVFVIKSSSSVFFIYRAWKVL